MRGNERRDKSMSSATYTKIMHLDNLMIDGLLEGEVLVEEKIDGSQFRVKINKKGDLTFGSKGVNFADERPIEKMFKMAVEIFKKQFIENSTEFIEALGNPVDDIYIFAEYLSKPRMNTLNYERIPKNHICIFDICCYNKFKNHEDKKRIAEILGFETPQILFVGDGKELTREKIDELLKTKSMLGNEFVEGIVIKNYNKMFDITKYPYMIGKFMAGKEVRPEFSELNKKNWKEIKKSPIQILIETLKTEARWDKAIQHLKEEGKLENIPKDIPTVIHEIIRDVEEEEKETIKEALWEGYWREIRIGITKGVAEWYKKKLEER